MAQVSEFNRDTLIGIHLTLFNALPGAERLAWMIQQYEAGMTQVQIADALTSTYAEDFAAVAPPAMSGLVVGTVLADRLLDVFGKIVPVDDWAWVRQWLSDMFDAGTSYSALIVEAVNALRATTGANFTQAKALLDNRIALSAYIALDLQKNPVNLAEAQDLVAFVDHSSGSVDIAKQYVIAAQQAATALTSGADTLMSTLFKAFPVYGPGASDATNTLQAGDVLTGSGSSATLNVGITTRDSAHLAPVLNGIAAVNLWVTGEQLLIMDLQNASGLRKLTINSDVRVDVHGLRTDGQADEHQLEIDARGVAGDLLLFVDTSADVGQLNTASPGVLSDLVIITGQGAANILIEGVLAGSIESGSGGSDIRVGRSGDSDMLGISTITSAAGRVIITAADMLATPSDKGVANNAGFDDVKAATIAVNGGGIYVQHLLSSQDWDGASRFQWIGASIVTTGERADQVNFFTMADGTHISTGADDDTVRVMDFSNQAVLAADSDGDGRGAVLDMGAGEDSLSFEDIESPQRTDTVIVGRNALVQGAESVMVEAFDRVAVTTLSNPTDTAFAFIGTRFLELEIENQTQGANDDDDTDGSIEVDLGRFDAALELIMMESHENHEIVFDEGGNYYQAGAPTAFTLHNARLTTVLILDAWDVTTHLLNQHGVLIDDTCRSKRSQTLAESCRYARFE
jgi:hypothetical protein